MNRSSLREDIERLNEAAEHIMSAASLVDHDDNAMMEGMRALIEIRMVRFSLESELEKKKRETDTGSGEPSEIREMASALASRRAPQ